MKRLTYDHKGKHFCDYTTREIINRLAECEIMLEKIEQIVKEPHDGCIAKYQKIEEVIKDGDDD